MVVDKDVWEEAAEEEAEEEAEEAEERRDTESKTRTPHKDVGEKNRSSEHPVYVSNRYT